MSGIPLVDENGCLPPLMVDWQPEEAFPEGGIPPTYGYLLHDPATSGRSIAAQAMAVRGQHWKTVLLENRLPEKITGFVKFTMQRLYGSLPNSTYDRVFRRQVDEYNISSFVLVSGSNTREQPLVIEVPALLAPCLRILKQGRFAAFALPTRRDPHRTPNSVPCPAALLALDEQNRVFETTGAKELVAGQLNTLHHANRIQLGRDFWTTRPLDTGIDPRTGQFLCHDRIIWDLTSKVQQSAGGPFSPLYLTVKFVLHPQRVHQLIRLLYEEEHGALLPAARQGPLPVPVLRIHPGQQFRHRQMPP
ncbi:hypothetical protein JCM8547_008843 [Rhodosporidiobolus lusitaniae]